MLKGPILPLLVQLCGVLVITVSPLMSCIYCSLCHAVIIYILTVPKEYEFITGTVPSKHGEFHCGAGFNIKAVLYLVIIIYNLVLELMILQRIIL